MYLIKNVRSKNCFFLVLTVTRILQPFPYRDAVSRTVSRTRPILAPIVLICATIGAVAYIRHVAAQPRGNELMQVEMNKQYDRFQTELTRSTEALLSMQSRLSIAEKSREDLMQLYQTSQKELVTTQKALSTTQQALQRAQAALSDLKSDYEAQLSSPSSKEGEAKKLSAVSGAPDIGAAKLRVESVTRELEQTSKALKQNEEALRSTWEDYMGLLKAIDAAKRVKEKNETVKRGDRYVAGPPFVPPAVPAIINQASQASITSAALIEPLSGPQSAAALQERLAQVTTELLGQQTLLESVMREIKLTNKSILEGRSQLQALEEDIRRQAPK